MRAAPRPQRRLAPLVVAALAALIALPASAFLSDDEARKAIIDLRGRVAASDDATRARLAELADKAAASERANAQLLEQVAALRKSLLDELSALQRQGAVRADIDVPFEADALMAQEGQFLGALGAVTGYAVADGVLTLTAPEGKTIRARR